MTLPIGRGMERPRTLGVECCGGQHRLVSPHPCTYLIRGTLLKILPKQQSQGATPTVISILFQSWGCSGGRGEGRF